MKLKRWHLYIIATLCFVLTFVTLNTKYDKFYRVNGIDNNNRALIEMYLDEKEQEYLIEHAIPVKQFINYIEYDDFKLQYYQYYNLLSQAKKETNVTKLLQDANTIADRLSIEFETTAYEHFELLVKYDLEYAYLNSSYFEFDNITYYQILRKLYMENDYEYIMLANVYLDTMQKEKVPQITKSFKNMVSTYDARGVKILMTTSLSEDAKRLYTVDPYTQVITSQTFIANYAPKNLTDVNNIPRLNYSMYIESDANVALNEMYNAMDKSMRKNFILTKSYTSYEILNSNQPDKAGYSEYQLGTTINIKQKNVKDEEFQTTELYQWLMQHSYEYGYILRYPKEKALLTGQDCAFEFRYVGKDIAKKIHDNNWCLEEYNQSNTKK